MCNICNERYGHDIWCPDYVNSELRECNECGSYIHQGQGFYKLGDLYFHKDCINNLTATDVLEILNIEVQNGN
jgi:hypothetical protein